MNIAFCLFKYFPFGGLQRDFMRIAKTCVARGHEVHVYTSSWEGEKETGLHIHLLPLIGKQNHTRNLSFANQVHAQRKKRHHDILVGFNKMPGLDIYYAADVCYQARVREKYNSWWYRLLPRYRQLQSMEKSIFAAGQTTRIILISKNQQKDFMHYYQTEAQRFHFVTPGIARDRIAPANAAEIRNGIRAQWQIKNKDSLLLMVGSGFKTKGLDRAIKGLAALPESLRQHAYLFVIGNDKPAAFQKLARQLHVSERVKFLGGRDDVANFLLAADVLVHPAYHENTGTVLLEAVVSGLPVLTVDACGYAHYIAEAKAGLVLATPFVQDKYNALLQHMLVSPEAQEWKQNALNFAQSADIYSLPEKTVDYIEQVGRERVSAS
jgi:UDP-glucose:(heptosyl)LPS alpha-1,3-glucosyltransferase